MNSARLHVGRHVLLFICCAFEASNNNASCRSDAAIVGVTSDIEGVTAAVVETWRRGADIVHQANDAHKLSPPLRFSVDAQTQWAWEPAISTMNCGNRHGWPPGPPPTLAGFPGAVNQSLMDVTMDIVDEVILMDYGGGAPYNWMARAWPWFARSRVGWSLSNRTRSVLISMGMEAGLGNSGAQTELEVETYLNDTAQSALFGYRPDGPTRFYGCANLFNGYCPFLHFAVFMYANYRPMTEAAPCPAGACVHRQPRAVWMYETPKLLYNESARIDFINWCSLRAVDELYIVGTGLPGCSAGNATTKAAFAALVAELHAHMINVQINVGDEAGPGCPKEDPTHPAQCDIYPCIRASVDLAIEQSAQRHGIA